MSLSIAQAYAEELAYDEYLHVKFLIKALGNNTVPCPALDLGSAFSTAANAATGLTLDPPYSPYFSDSWFLLGAYIFEDVGKMLNVHDYAQLVQEQSLNFRACSL